MGRFGGNHYLELCLFSKCQFHYLQNGKNITHLVVLLRELNEKSYVMSIPLGRIANADPDSPWAGDGNS